MSNEDQKSEGMPATPSQPRSEPGAAVGQPLAKITPARVPASQAIDGGGKQIMTMAPSDPPDSARKWSMRRPMLIGWLAVVLLIGGGGLWAMGTRISGAVIAVGRVEVEQRRQVVQHLDGGVVSEILVGDGERVSAGQTLIRLDGVLLKTELAIVESQYFEVLARRGRLEAERADIEELTFPEELIIEAAGNEEVAKLIDGQTSLFVARRDTLKQSLEQLQKQSEQVDSEIEGIEAQLSALDRQRDLIAQELVDQESLLERGLTQASRVLELQRRAAQLDGEIGELQADKASAETRKTEIDIQRLSLNAQRREQAETQLRDIGSRELELTERRRGLIERVNRLDIRSPAAGVVYDLQVTTPGAVIQPGQNLMYVVPQDRPLVIAAQVAPINIDEVEVGQPVVLRFSAFSSRTTPEIDGVLSKISADSLTDEVTGAAFYRSEVTILPDQLKKLGDLSLVPGMPVEVYIQTGERSPLSFLIKPLSDYFSRAFREG